MHSHPRPIKSRKATRNLAILLAVIALAACSAQVGGGHESEDVPFDGSRAYRLAAEQLAMGPRHPGAEGHARVGAWIAEALRVQGWQTAFQEFSHEGLQLRNVIGRRGRDDGPDIILGAHYDTRPVADQDETARGDPVPGANDGASGVAVLLELARVLPEEANGCRVTLAFFDAEDSGGLPGWDWILGSTAYAGSLKDAPDAVVIVDMVGDKDLNLFLERNSDPALAETIWDTGAQLGYDAFIPQPKYAMIDDHTPFLQRGWAAVDIIDFDYPYWHTTRDSLDKIAPASLEAVGRTLQVWIEGLCN